MASKKSKPKPSTLLKQALAMLGREGEQWTKHDERIEPGSANEDGKVYPEGAFCSIGVLHEVNTPNETRAIAYLAFVIKLEKNDFEESDEDTIIDNNDLKKTKFSDVKRWFVAAIKLAKFNGD